MINVQKKEYIDNKAKELIGLIKPTNIDFSKKENKPTGNLAGLEIIDITDKIADLPQKVSYSTYEGETVGLIELYKNKTYGLEADDYKQMKLLIDQVYKEKKIQQLIGYHFIYKTVVEWLFKSYRDDNQNRSLFDFLVNEINDSIQTYNVYIPVLYLDIESAFQIGRVLFTYFSDEYLENLENNYKKDNPNKDNPFPNLGKLLKGQVYATISLKAEAEKAKEIAFQECSLTLDCLRICSPVMVFPKIKSDFDLEKRSNAVLENNIVLQPVNSEYSFLMTKVKNANHFRIDAIETENFKQMNLGSYHRFLLENREGSEIERLIINSITSFSEALKDQILQRRISKLFTIFESLLVKNENTGILESLCRYGPKLIFQELKDRDEITRVFKELYKIRSAYTHHLKYNKFAIEDLKKLQVGLSILLTNLIRLSKKYETKEKLLELRPCK